MANEHLTGRLLVQVAELLQGLESLEQPDQDVYLLGDLRVMHKDGYQVGFLKSYEDWWHFDPEYAEEE